MTSSVSTRKYKVCPTCNGTDFHLVPTGNKNLYRRKYRKLIPGWEDCLKTYISVIDKEVNENTRILDIGCGHADYLKEVYGRTEHVYGIDPDKKAMEKNEVIQYKVVGEANKLPYPNDSFLI